MNDIVPTQRVKGGTSKAAAVARREMFAHAFIANGRNGTQAAITAGFAPGSAQVTASQLLSDPMVRGLVDQLTAKMQAITGLTVERVLREVARVAFFDRRKLYRPDGTEKSPTEWDDDTAAAISHINATGPVPFDKNAALEKAFKHLGLYQRDNTQQRENIRVQVVLVGWVRCSRRNVTHQSVGKATGHLPICAAINGMFRSVV